MESFTDTTAKAFLLKCVQPIIDEGISGQVVISTGNPVHSAPIDVEYYDDYRLVVSNNISKQTEINRSVLLIKDCPLRADICAVLTQAPVTLFIKPDLNAPAWWQRDVPFMIEVGEGLEISDSLTNLISNNRLNLFGGLLSRQCLASQIFTALRDKERHIEGLKNVDETLLKLSDAWESVTV